MLAFVEEIVRII